mmetsp:Transcript_1644/g.2629  ORF Transcript_1644/g.2629 Transcript_1644/m.2629 type:complete len:89 (-) Transcript_1644:782-1048(-)
MKYFQLLHEIEVQRALPILFMFPDVPNSIYYLKIKIIPDDCKRDVVALALDHVTGPQNHSRNPKHCEIVMVIVPLSILLCGLSRRRQS